MEQLKAAHELMEYDDEIVTSSVKNFNVDAFIETVAHFLPEGPRWFPEDMGTDASDETLVAEFVREKVLRRTRDEIPHSVGVICDALEQTKKVLRVHATIYVEREGQKGIIIGKGGEMIKHIGIDARRDLERIFGTQVFLELDVKVKAGATTRPRFAALATTPRTKDARRAWQAPGHIAPRCSSSTRRSSKRPT